MKRISMVKFGKRIEKLSEAATTGLCGGWQMIPYPDWCTDVRDITFFHLSDAHLTGLRVADTKQSRWKTLFLPKTAPTLTENHCEFMSDHIAHRKKMMIK